MLVNTQALLISRLADNIEEIVNVYLDRSLSTSGGRINGFVLQKFGIGMRIGRGAGT
jgi:hypothetical protein